MPATVTDFSNPLVLFGALFLIACATLAYLRKFLGFSGKTETVSTGKSAKNFAFKSNTTVTSVPDNWEWETSEGIKQFPFKNGPYKLTMGIKLLDKQDWLLIEPNYKIQTSEKTAIINNPELAEKAVALSEDCVESAKELYDEVTAYLVAKYPNYFIPNLANNTIENKILDTVMPLNSKGRNTYEEVKELVVTLGKNIQEDFIILKKDPARSHEEFGHEYFYKGGMFAFAAGFDPSTRFNKPLTMVHWPIPKYDVKLQTSMNRFFENIPKEVFVNRNNFSVQPNGDLFLPHSTKSHEEEEQIKALKFEDMDFDKYHYRSERQVLTRLPKTGSIVFTIRTYIMPISQLKASGKEVANRFATAIRGIPEDIARYKRSAEWGEGVVKYLEME